MAGDFQLSGDDDQLPQSGAAIIGGLAFIVFFGCLSLVLSDNNNAESRTWWYWFGGSICVLIACIIAYRRPRGPISLVIVLIYGLVSGSLLLWFTIGWGGGLFRGFDELDFGTKLRAGIGIPLAIIAMWAGWATFMIRSISYTLGREPPRPILRFLSRFRRDD